MSLAKELKELEAQGIDLLEILGKDRHLDSPEALQKIISALSCSDDNLYVELLFQLTWRRFPLEEAVRIWAAITEHKKELEQTLEREVGFRVAALDYLFSVEKILQGARLVARAEFESILTFVNIDEVTGVHSRRYFNERLGEELGRARRYSHPLSMLIIDLDNFKQVNDRCGHVEGDSVLRKVGRMLMDTTRQADVVCRFGGDEFAVLLPETGSEDAGRTAERIRLAVADISVPGEDEPGNVTLSIGCAAFPESCDEAEEMLALADQMCLDVKRAGKNGVRIAPA
ncbi:MAG: GGDEF domain-containing protein [Planctomycetota bacterium]|nr:GGDEF domain-containing protein [Planctomycetota bacterium]|tara:strand:- start:304 stop:1161 length:858 start_codon:yes stop_codon:yes gene_type:complete